MEKVDDKKKSLCERGKIVVSLFVMWGRHYERRPRARDVARARVASKEVPAVVSSN